MTPEAHKKHHVELHAALDELVGDWLIDTGKMPSESSIAELMQWSYTQTKADTGEPVAIGPTREYDKTTPQKLCDPPVEATPVRVGKTHVRFADHTGIVRVMPITKIELLADERPGKHVFGCAGFFVAESTYDGISDIIAYGPVIDDYPKITVDKPGRLGV